MKKTYTKEDLQYILDLYKSPNLVDYAIIMANQLFHEFANDDANIEETAYDTFQEVLDKFSLSNMSKDNEDYNGEIIDEGSRSLAADKFNQLIHPVDETVQTNPNENLNTPAEETVSPDTPTPQDERQDVPVYTKADLEEILRLSENDATRDDARGAAEQFLEDFANGDADVDDDALESLQQIIDTFGAERTDGGDLIYTDLGNRAINRMQSTGVSLENTIISDRINSMTSDDNQIMFNLITLNVYKDMGLVDASVDTASMTPQQVSEKIDSIELNDDQRMEYSNRFFDIVVNDRELFELTPYSVLTDAYVFTKKQLLQKPGDNALSQRFKTVARRIDDLIINFQPSIEYLHSDPSKIADIYAGYRAMCEARRPDLQATPNEITKQYNQRINTAIDETMAQLEEVVKTYSEMWNLRNLRPGDAEKLDARWQKISEKLKDVELSNEMLAILAKYQFLDENDQPIPQFLDENGNPHIDFQPGYTLNPNGRLYRIISLAKTDVTMRNIGDLNTDVQDMDLESALSERVPWKMAEISVVDQGIQGIERNPQRMLNEQEVNDIWNGINTNGGQISDRGYQAALHDQVNRAGGWAGMMAEQVGSDKPIVMRPFEAVQDIDRLASTRSERIGAEERNKKIGLFKRIVKHFAVAAGVSTGLSIIGHATGFAYAGAIVGTTLGIGNMVYQGFKWRKAQKAAGKPYGIKDFFADKRNWGPAIASGLGIAAVISMASGAPELSAAFGVGAIAIGGGSAAKATYDDAIAAGYTKGQAVAAAVGVMGASVIGGVVGAPYGETPPYGIGTFGIYEPRQERKSSGFLTRMRERLGALADRASELVPQDGGDRPHDGSDRPHDDGRPHDDDNRPHDDDHHDDDHHDDDNRPHDDDHHGDDRPHDDTGRDGERNTTGGDSKPQEHSSTKRGFFGKCKDVTYKIMRSAFHGLQKMQKGVNKMKDEQQQSKLQRRAAEEKAAQRRALDRANFAKRLNESYKDLDIRELGDTLTKDAQVLAGEDEEFQRTIGKRIQELIAELNMTDLRDDAARTKKLADIQLLAAQVQEYQSASNAEGNFEEIVRKLYKIQNEIAKMEAQGQVDVNVINARGAGKVQGIADENRTSHLRNLGQAARAVLRGWRDKTKQDVESAKYEKQIAELEAEIEKINGPTDTYKAAIKRLKEQMRRGNYSEEELAQLRVAVIQQNSAALGNNQ